MACRPCPFPRADGNGRVVAAEVMRVTGTIRDCIMDPERMPEIHDLIAEGREQYGSQTFDQHLMDLVKAGTVDFKIAMAAANNPSDFDLKMNMLSQTPVAAGVMASGVNSGHFSGS